jgi:hypothetical protein
MLRIKRDAAQVIDDVLTPRLGRFFSPQRQRSVLSAGELDPPDGS